MSLLNNFIQYIKDKNLFQRSDQLLLAISGGIDSVVLAELCYQAGYSFFIAHCNFHLRGEESTRDENFVRNLADNYSVPFYIQSFDTEEYARQNKISIQVAARELRYIWFRQLAEEVREKRKVGEQKLGGPVKILTAHHANDALETLLMNFFKGTGIKGLQGILPKQGDLIRPLLFATKEEIVQFSREKNLSFVEDSSNLSNKYTRNYFRNQLIPSVQKIFPQVEENLVNNLERFKEIDLLYTQAINFHKSKLIQKMGKEIHIPVLKLEKISPLKTVLYEIIKDYGFTAHQTDEAIKLIGSETGKYISSATHRIIKNRMWLIIAPADHAESNLIVIEKTDNQIHFEQGKLTFKQAQKLSTDSTKNAVNKVLVDSDQLKFPLILRKWKQGDYFYPLGIKKKGSDKPGKKKLSKFLIDQKISLLEKEFIWVLESNKRIVWVLNKRMDDRFKITPQTKTCVSIEFTASEKFH